MIVYRVLALGCALVVLVSPLFFWNRTRLALRRAHAAIRCAARRARRMRRLRSGKYVWNLTLAEVNSVLAHPGIDALHPLVQLDIRAAQRRLAEAVADAA